MQDGQLVKLTGSNGEKNLTLNVDAEAASTTTLVALILAGCAICLVAIAIILFICFIYVRRNSGSFKIESKEEEEMIREYRRNS